MIKHHPFRSAAAKRDYMNLNEKMAGDWPVPSESVFISTSFGETFVRISGPVDAPPLVLLPGALSCSLTWLPNIGDLSQDYRTYGVDTLINTGCVGRSRYSSGITNEEDAVRWLDELFAGLDLSAPSVAGMSYGGLLASLFAIHFPERLDRMILLAPAILPIDWKFIIKAVPALYKPTYDSYKSFLHWHLDMGNISGRERTRMEAFIDMMATASQSFEKTAYMQPRALKVRELKRIEVPTYLLVGEKDRSYPVEKAIKKLKRVVPRWKIETLPGVGHGLPMAEPEIVNRKILDFLG